MTLDKLLDLIRAVKNMNDDIVEVKFEMWGNGHTRVAIRSKEFTDYYNAVNFDELEDILSQMLSL